MTLAVNIAQSGSNNASFRNRIINGGMVIDQRNAGASVSAVDGAFQLDRWKTTSYDGSAQTGKFTVQQTPSVTETGYATRVAAGFLNYLAATSSAATSLGSSAQYVIAQNIEGLNIPDLAWGTASAKTITLSFYAYSSLTGTFGGSVSNSAANRSYPFTYSIPVANTWTQISVTIAGDTSGTWLTTNGIGLRLNFSMGSGTTVSGTAGAWAGAQYTSATGAVSVVGTNGATFYITGVQLEAGTTASPFEYRQYGTELALCRRYYEKFDFGSGTSMHGAAQQTNQLECNFIFYPKRASPSCSVNSGTYYRVNDWRGGDEACNGTVNIDSSVPTNDRVRLQFQKATSNLTVGYAGYMNKQGGAAANPMLYVSAEL